MSKSLKNLAIIALFLVSSLCFGMEPKHASMVKIETNDNIEQQIESEVAKTSETLKNLIEDLGEGSEQAIPLPEVSKEQLDLLIPVMSMIAERTAKLHEWSDNPQLREELTKQRYKIETDFVSQLNDNLQDLTNDKLIEFIAGANFLEIPVVDSALEALHKRALTMADVQKLITLNLWSLLDPLGTCQEAALDHQFTL